jgi:hypothetical protein
MGNPQKLDRTCTTAQRTSLNSVIFTKAQDRHRRRHRWPLRVSKIASTFYDWRAKGRAPRCIKLPNRDLRIRRTELERWLDTCGEAA